MKEQNPIRESELMMTRRQLFGRAALGLGTAALADIIGPDLLANSAGQASGTHFAPKAKRVIYLFMSGAPSQLDMWDYKPKMQDWYDKDLPDSVRNGQRITTMTSGQKRFPIAPSTFKFQRHGRRPLWFREDDNVQHALRCVAGEFPVTRKEEDQEGDAARGCVEEDRALR